MIFGYRPCGDANRCDLTDPLFVAGLTCMPTVVGMSDPNESHRSTENIGSAMPKPGSVVLNSGYLYHAAAREEWDNRSFTEYVPSSYQREGFIHLSSAGQLLTPLHSFYLGRSDLLLLTVDEGRVLAPVIWEDLYDGGQEFPHVYGALNLDSIVATVEMPCDEFGRFDWVAESS